MQNSKMWGAACAMALSAASLSFASGAFAQAAFQGQAKLAQPVAAPTTATVNGVTWSCAADACTGEAAHYSSLDNPVRECKRVAAALGQLAAYSARGREVTGGSLKVCNSEASAKAGGASSLAAKQ
ncbi:MAG: hypothetical protein JWP49_2795 [Phenylobacterium sp.]|nr:hypothetical protein [Phenylobacterium sp.]